MDDDFVADLRNAAPAIPVEWLEGVIQFTNAEETGSELEGSCASCGAPALMKCSGCAGACKLDRSGQLNIWYCSKQYQVSDRPLHKALCQRLHQRVLLARAALFLKIIWQIYRRSGWDLNIKKIQVEGSCVVMHEGKLNKEYSSRFIRPFPDALTEDNEIRNVLLNFRTCEDAIACLSPMLKEILEGNLQRIQQIRILFKNPELRPMIFYPDGKLSVPRELKHVVWKVTMKSGEIWAIDPTGRQYGSQTVFMGWAEFAQAHILEETGECYWRDFNHFYTLTAGSCKNSLLRLYQHNEQYAAAQLFLKYLKLTIPNLKLRALNVALRGTQAAVDEFTNKICEALVFGLQPTFDDWYESEYFAKYRMNILKEFFESKGSAKKNEQEMKLFEARILEEEAEDLPEDPPSAPQLPLELAQMVKNGTKLFTVGPDAGDEAKFTKLYTG